MVSINNYEKQKSFFSPSCTSLFVFVFCFFTLINSNAQATVNWSTMNENSCRTKAKEVATETYKDCMSEIKSAKIEKIKSDYTKELKAIKAKYEAEIKKLTNDKNSVSSLTAESVTADKSSTADKMTVDKPKFSQNKTTDNDPRISVKKESLNTKETKESVNTKETKAIEYKDDQTGVVDIPEPVTTENPE